VNSKNHTTEEKGKRTQNGCVGLSAAARKKKKGKSNGKTTSLGGKKGAKRNTVTGSVKGKRKYLKGNSRSFYIA